MAPHLERGESEYVSHAALAWVGVNHPIDGCVAFRTRNEPCVDGMGDGSDVIMIGDSWMAGIAPPLVDVSGQPYRNHSVGGRRRSRKSRWAGSFRVAARSSSSTRPP